MVMCEMGRQRRLASIGPAVIGLVFAAIVWTGPAGGQTPPAVANPHGTYGPASDSCKKCHALHDAVTPTALLDENDPRVCYSCHDGSTQATDVQSAFGTLTAPRTSDHPVPGGTLKCADCHTPHKSPAEDTAQLRVMVNGSYVYSPPEALGTPIGNDFCYACHGTGPALPAPNGDHLVFETGIHNTSANVPFPASGSKIKCLACHQSHGSDEPGLTLDGLPQEQLCFGCHTSSTPQTSGGTNPPWPTAVPGSDIVSAFATANDTSTADGNGIRIYHHPIAPGEQGGGTRRVECVSCHNSHTASASDTATTSKIADPARVLASDATWIPAWDTSSGYMNRASNVTQYCTTCHQDPATTTPVGAGQWVPFTVSMVNDTAPDADGTAHDTFDIASWKVGPHGDTSLDPTQLTYPSCAARGLTGPECVVTCTACHDFHGTSNAYMLRETVDAPDSDATATITGFTALDTSADRLKLQTFCLTCHQEQSVTHHPDQLCTTCHSHGSGQL